MKILSFFLLVVAIIVTSCTSQSPLEQSDPFKVSHDSIEVLLEVNKRSRDSLSAIMDSILNVSDPDYIGSQKVFDFEKVHNQKLILMDEGYGLLIQQTRLLLKRYKD
jgi:hypothetical protein